ncbi:hypothetical protein BJ508DRAFT_412474 [Ascobolus immersus RN42]|uniref:Uncharacterized protein n=1 Tax=Ascobolus immersus RN42 TaxID=1160509 RepID=A0A3N4IGG6_ASCIM|nr:hypothetical protein BJ508DRAFT_412474 [Ascobolus immersus RN42]
MRSFQLTPAFALLLLSGKSFAQVCSSSSLVSGVQPAVTDYPAFEAKIAKFTATATGAEIPVYTDTVDLGATTVTAVGYAKSDALVAAGYTVTSGYTVVEAPCTPTAGGLPPKPSGNCHAHGDHWHCDEEDEHDDDHATSTSSVPASTTVTPSTPSPTNGKNCTSHGDHWHCDEDDHDDHDDHEDEDSGSKTTVPPATPSPTDGKNCTAHGDHWHCDEEHDDHDDKETGSKTTVTPAVPSPTDGKNCTAHGDHWHCDGEDDDHSEETNGTVKTNGTTSPVKEGEEDSASSKIGMSIALSGVLGSAVVALLL